MRNPRAPIFLARRAYRQRRLADAARLLPVVGVFLFLVPVLWHTGATEAPDTGRGAIYLFAVWALLIAGAALLARRLGSEDQPDDQDGRDAP